MSELSPPTKEEFEKFMIERYAADQGDRDAEIMKAVDDLLSKHQRHSIDSFLLNAGMLIRRQFDFREVAIGLMHRSDGLYRYELLMGFTQTAQEALSKIRYTYEDMIDDEKYPNVKLGRTIEFLITMADVTEKQTYSRPGMLAAPRKSLDDFIEGDYIDIFMYGDGGELIGWLELSAPKSGKIPDSKTLLWLELIGSIIGRVLWERNFSK